MGEETFSLTQVNEHSRLLLPSLTAPHNLERRKDTSFLSSSRYLNKSNSSTARVQERLSQVREDVKASFDLLYTSRRDLLLSKVMEMERTASVKDQLQALETQVVAQLKTYNALHSRRKKKQQLLRLYEQELSILQNKETDTSPIQSTAATISTKYSKALHLIDNEEDYTDTLEHMMGETSKAIARLLQPVNRLRKDLQQAKIRHHDLEVDFLRVSMESKSMKSSLERKEEELKQRKAHHNARIQERLQFFRRREEFSEFMSRQKDQKQIQTKIKELEIETNLLESVQKSTEAAELLVESSMEQLESLQSYERQTDKLSRAARVSSIQQVIDYWDYLQSFSAELSAKVEVGDRRVSDMREELGRLKDERMSVKLLLGDQDQGQLSRLQEVLESKEERVVVRQEKVVIMQLRLWEQAVAGIRSILEGLYVSAGGQAEEMDIEQLMERTAAQLLSLHTNN
jgi:hypothetical protein